MSLTSLVSTPQPTLAWDFNGTTTDYVSGLVPNLITSGTYAAPTGGTITTSGANRIHTFTTVGTTSITFLVPVTAQVLVVAGGGGGGSISSSTFSPGGGGGAGEVYYSASYSIAAGTYTVTVGAGGAGGPEGGVSQNGSDSVFGSISANGGGHGGDGSGVIAGDGGSGGGAARQQGAGGSSVKTAGGQGNNGGTSTGFSGAGGGGAGGVGVNQTVASTSSTGTAGGPGVTYSISGSSVTYGVGGAGGSRSGGTSGANGTANRGNGGAGAGTLSSATGGNGGSGIVVISYNNALYPAPTYVTGKFRQAINFNNTLSPAGADPNCYATYDVSSFNLSSNSGAMSLWLNSGLTYPITLGSNPYYINLQGATTYYSLQTENTPSRLSNISFHTGSSPGAIISQAALTGWNHYCAVFSNVGTTGASNTASYFYLNGSLVGSGNTRSQNFTTLYLGCQLASQNGALCSIDDLRIYNTALSAAQVQSIYQAQGMPSRGAVVSSKRAPGSTAIYSTNWVNPSYSGAIVNVERASDGAVSDFYVDKSGNFTQNSGTSLTSWLGGAQANVLIWYDQSGAGLNAIKDNTTIYGRAPQLVVDPAGSGKYVIYFPNQNSTATNYYGFRISAQTTASMMCRFYVKSGKINDSNWESLLCTNVDNRGVRFAGLNMNTGDGNDFLNPGGFAIYDGTYKNTSPFLTATRDSWHTMMVSRASGTLSMEYIGQCNASWNSGVIIARSLYGYMTDMVTFTASPGPSAYSSYFASPVTTLTGTPLFNQLSQAARSSAVGAFSLRAVNGTSAKAVQVRNGTTGATQDFYADRLGNLLTAPVTGQTLANWLGGATGYVTTWYDQSGAGNHATQATAANQPIIQRATKGPGYMVLFNGVNGTTSYGLNFGAYDILNNTSYSVCGVVRRKASGTTSNENYYLSGAGGTNSQDKKFHNGYRLSAQFTLAHYSDDMNVTVPAFTAPETEPINYNFSTLGTDKVGRIYSYSGGSLYPSPTTTRTFVGFLNHAVGTSFSIGGGFRQFTGEIYELIVFTQSLYDLDGTTSINQIYQNQLSYTGN